jgi:DNA replication protein DnaC
MSTSGAPPRHAGGFLREAIAQVSCNLDELKAAAGEDIIPAHDLFASGPTEHSLQMVERCETAIAGYKEKGVKIPKDLAREHPTCIRKLRVALRRDELMAERRAVDPDCWCLGFGGRRPTGMYAISRAGRLVADPEGREMLADCCRCALGRARQAEDDAVKRELLAADQQRQLRKLWSIAKVPEIPQGIGLDTHPDRVKVDLCRRWYEGEFKRGLVLAGLNQRGKTTVAFLLAHQAIELGRGVLAFTLPDLLGRLKETFNHDSRLRADPEQPEQRTHQQLIDSLVAAPFLLLDDLGAEQMTDYVETALYQILDGRCLADPDEWQRTIITTNLKKDELALRLGDRLWSRVSKLCDRVVFDGPVIGPAIGGLSDLEDLAS